MSPVTNRVQALFSQALAYLLRMNKLAWNPHNLEFRLHVLERCHSGDVEVRVSATVHGRALISMSVVSVDALSRAPAKVAGLVLERSLSALWSAVMTPLTLSQWASVGCAVEDWVLDQALECGHLSADDAMSIRLTR